MPQFWAGICEDRIHTREVDDGFGGWGERKVRAPALFTSRAEARKEYEEVCKVEVRIVSKRPSRK